MERKRKLVFATVVHGALYAHHAKILLRSFMARNKAFHRPFIIIHDKDLKETQKEAFRNEYPLVEFWKTEAPKYKKRLRAKDKRILSPPRFPGYYSFEIANPEAMNAERVVFFDADMVCDNIADEVIGYTGRVCMMKEPKHNQFSAAIIVVNNPDNDLYSFLMTTCHSNDVNDGWGTDQNIWNQWKGITKISNPNSEVHRWSPKGYGGCDRPAFWHYIAKYKKSSIESPPHSGGWKNTQDRPKKLFEAYDKWKPLYPHRPFKIFATGRNCGPAAVRCIKSIVAQSDPHWEMVVIDDASVDNTWELMRRDIKDERVTLIRHEERRYGPYSRCEAIRTFKDLQADDIIVQVDLDDALLPQALHRILMEYRSNPDVWMTYGNLRDQNGKRYQPKNPKILDTWRSRERMICLAPRSFRAGLFWEVGDQEFQYGGKWLPCKFDVAATSAMQEMAGSSRMRRIQTVIYDAEVDTKRNVVGAFGHTDERRYREYVLGKPRRQKLEAYRRTAPDASSEIVRFVSLRDFEKNGESPRVQTTS